jgi:alpha-ribazole phosphatase
VRLLLIRHPPAAVPEGVCYGRTDLPLRAPADGCAERLTRLIAAAFVRPPPLFTSPSQRCAVLARALHPAPEEDPRLMELDFGDWEMRRWSELPRGQIDAWAADPVGYAVPGGESVAALCRRTGDFLHELARRRIEDAVLVTHGGVMRACVRRLVPTQSAWLSLSFAYGSASLIDGRRLRWRNRP